MIALNTIHFSPYEYGLDFISLISFALGSFVIVYILILYYNRIPKSNFEENEINVKRTTSRLPKLFVYLLIIIPGIILLVEFFNFGNLFTSFDIFMLGFFFALIIYLSLTPKIKKIFKRQKLDNPIYQSTDILLQSKSNEANFVIAKKSTSIFVKVLVFILILYIIANPFSESLSFDFFY